MAVWNRDLIVQKIDKVLGDTKQILTALSGGTGAVKSVQRGTARFTGKVTHVHSNNIEQINTLDIKIDEVNPAKCVVLIDDWAFDKGITGDVSSEVKSIRICVANITTNTLTLRTTVNDIISGMYDEEYFVFDDSSLKVGDIVPSTATFGWQLIEYY